MYKDLSSPQADGSQAALRNNNNKKKTALLSYGNTNMLTDTNYVKKKRQEAFLHNKYGHKYIVLDTSEHT